MPAPTDVQYLSTIALLLAVEMLKMKTFSSNLSRLSFQYCHDDSIDTKHPDGILVSAHTLMILHNVLAKKHLGNICFELIRIFL